VFPYATRSTAITLPVDALLRSVFERSFLFFFLFNEQRSGWNFNRQTSRRECTSASDALICEKEAKSTDFVILSRFAVSSISHDASLVTKPIQRSITKCKNRSRIRSRSIPICASRTAISLFIGKQRELSVNYYIAAVLGWNFRNLYFWIDRVKRKWKREKGARSWSETLAPSRMLRRIAQSLELAPVSRFNFLPRWNSTKIKVT